MRSEVEAALSQQQSGVRVPFSIFHLQRKEHIGSTSLWHVDATHRSLEIGSTWLASAFHGTGINRECKELLLEHAFTQLGMNRVVFQTDEQNRRSRRAIEKLGARFDGVMREDKVTWNGRVRSSAIYSILKSEWKPLTNPPAATPSVSPAISAPSVSPNVKTKGLVWFARMLQKARLHAAGQLGPDYLPWLGKGFDGRCVRFLHIEYPALLARVAQPGTDEEILEWCFTHGRRPADEEILIFNEFMVKRGIRDTDNPGQVEGYKTKNGFGGRSDIQTYFDVIEADEGRAGQS
jgi:RimJ/RimL family protein N-acetyltransferase